MQTAFGVTSLETSIHLGRRNLDVTPGFGGSATQSSLFFDFTTGCRQMLRIQPQILRTVSSVLNRPQRGHVHGGGGSHKEKVENKISNGTPV
jgi:hypothetical protein